MLAWQVRGRRVLVGGGDVSFSLPCHLYFLLSLITLNRHGVLGCCRSDPSCPQRRCEGHRHFSQRWTQPRSDIPDRAKQVDHVDRKFQPSDLDGVDMVLAAVDDPIASSDIYKLCKERRIPANIADVPPECDFYFGSVHRDGPLQIMVSTNGNGPKFASIVRKQIAETLPNGLGAAIAKVGTLRKKLRKIAPTTEEGPRRMQWLVTVFRPLTDLCLLGSL